MDSLLSIAQIAKSVAVGHCNCKRRVPSNAGLLACQILSSFNPDSRIKIIEAFRTNQTNAVFWKILT